MTRTSPAGLLSVSWAAEGALFRAVEPTAGEVLAVAPLLSTYYNDPHNSAMMAHTTTMSIADVIAHFDALRDEGGRAFLLYSGDTLVGDADLRHVEDGHAELAFMIGSRATQGKGLGTRFGIMVTALAFTRLARTRVYASILPTNPASLRAFQKMGYAIDSTPAARAFAEAEDELTVSIDRDTFIARHTNFLAVATFDERPSVT